MTELQAQDRAGLFSCTGMKFQPEKQERLPLMKTDFRTELILSGRMDFLPLALAYARELAVFAKLTHREINFMVLAVEEAC